MKAIINGRIIVPDINGNFKTLNNHMLIFDNYIQDILQMDDSYIAADIIDAKGCYVAPGFINIHIHGCGGADTMDDNLQSLSTIRIYQAKTGVTSFLPTTMTYDLPRIYRALERIRAARQTQEGAAILGCHMEGPFINAARKGAQSSQNIINADFSLIEKYKDIIRLITLAPETLSGNYSFVEQCQKNNITVSIGHSSAKYSVAQDAIKNHHITHITHLFNGMPPFHHRHPGIVGAALDSDVFCELITDNVHVHPVVQRMVYRLKNRGYIILITDSMRACLLGDGISELGGQKVYVKGQTATLSDGTIAGSVLTMDRAIANFMNASGAKLPEIIEMVTKNPAKELGIYQQIGSIEKGKQADITIFDDAIKIKTVLVNGHCVYTHHKNNSSD